MPSNYFPTSAIGAINELIISTLAAAEESGHRWLTHATGPRIKSLVLARSVLDVYLVIDPSPKKVQCHEFVRKRP